MSDMVDYWREKTAILRAAADEMHAELTRMHGSLCAEKSHAARLERERDEAIVERDKALASYEAIVTAFDKLSAKALGGFVQLKRKIDKPDGKILP